jgi:hypothetical protein
MPVVGDNLRLVILRYLKRVPVGDCLDRPQATVVDDFDMTKVHCCSKGLGPIPAKFGGAAVLKRKDVGTWAG